MRTLQFMVSVSALLLMSGCSTTKPLPEEQSVLEVVDSTHTTGVPRGCRVGEVNYCLTGPGGAKECTCLDAWQMSLATGGLFAP